MRFLILVVCIAVMSGCMKGRPDSSGGDDSSASSRSSTNVIERDSLENGQSLCKWFTTSRATEVTVQFSVEGGNGRGVRSFFATKDQWPLIKEGGPYAEGVRLIAKHGESTGTSWTVVVEPGQYVIVLSNLDAPDTVFTQGVVTEREPSAAGRASPVVYRSEGACPSCLSATCHKVHGMCSQCQGKGEAWSHIQNGTIACDRCHGTGRY
jgi:hypothetical protein